jgi:hypothetical protein
MPSGEALRAVVLVTMLAAVTARAGKMRGMTMSAGAVIRSVAHGHAAQSWRSCICVHSAGCVRLPPPSTRLTTCY